MTKYLLALVVLILAVSYTNAQPRKETRNAKRTEQMDKKFVQEATAAGITEVNLGTLGEAKGRHPMVKEFGAMMVKDHQMANKELMKLAQEKGYIGLPEQATETARKEHAQLMQMTGADFDKAFADQMVADHEKSTALFNEQAENGKDDQLKRWAAQKLPVLKEHLEHARRLVVAVKSEQ